MASASVHHGPAAPAATALPAPNGLGQGQGHGADTGANLPHRGNGNGNGKGNGNGNDTADNRHTTTTTSPDPDSPPAQIVSDIPGVSAAAPSPPIPTTAPATVPAPPFVNGLNTLHKVNGSNGGTHRHSHSPASPSPALPSPALPSPALPSPALPSPAPTTAAATATVSPPRTGHKIGSGRWCHQVPQAPSSNPAKIPIVDAAPGTGIPSPAPRPTSGFPSPGRENVHADPKFIDDRTRITYGIQQALPEAARRSVRDNWEKCLLGSDFHQAFILNASIHHATPAAIQRGIRDFGNAMIVSAKHEIIDQMTTQDLDQLADRILAKASVSLLDKALEKRLETIEAKRLINALARAERLGYEPGDIEDEAGLPSGQQGASGHSPFQDPQQRKDVSAVASAASGYSASPVDAAGAASFAGAGLGSAANTAPALPLHCSICFRRFAAKSAYDHHVKGKVCTRSPSSPGGFKYNCQHCGQGFTTVMGLQYHNTNKVCGDFGGEPAKAKPAPTIPPLPTSVTQRIATRPLPSTPSAPIEKASPTPAPPSSAASHGTPGLTQPDGTIADPYAHLSPEQLTAMQEELREAEIKFAERMRQANLIPDANEKKARLDALGNSFGTKQSLIRKKYGVRLRMRRTKTEIQAERDRMQYKTAAELQADLGFVSNGPGRPVGRPVASSYRPSPSLGSRPGSRPASSGGAGAVVRTGAGGSGWATVNQPLTTLASTLSVPKPKIEDSGEVGMHGKRRFSGDGELPQTKRFAYAEMGGLNGAVGVDAETMDPTLPSNVKANGKGTAAEPMALDDSDSESGEETGDEDIPAQLPASVRQSLQRSSSAATPGGGSSGSRPGSSSK